MLLTDKTSPIIALIRSCYSPMNTLGSNHVGSPVIGLAPSARQQRGSLKGQRKSGLPHTSPVQ